MRWTFSEIRTDSFHWTGERAPDGENWHLEVDIRARRRSPYGGRARAFFGSV
jgi:hypothetical protein